jgi:hypothetical protein
LTTDPYAPPKAQIADSADASAGPAANPHVLWRQLCGLGFWTAVLTIFGGLVAMLVGFTLAGVTFADAWVSGIYKRPGSKSFLNISPMAWGILMVGLFIVTFPVYLVNRQRLRTRRGTNVFFIATVILGALWAAAFVASVLSLL